VRPENETALAGHVEKGGRSWERERVRYRAERRGRELSLHPYRKTLLRSSEEKESVALPIKGLPIHEGKEPITLKSLASRHGRGGVPEGKAGPGQERNGAFYWAGKPPLAPSEGPQKN